MKKKKIVLGVTGGPATGKSLVAREFARLGAALIDADAVAREVVRPGTPVYCEVVRAFGTKILCPNGKLDRKALGRIVFSDYTRLEELTAITHPEILRIIRERIRALLADDATSVIVLDAPLLFESGLDAEMDMVVVVYVDEKVQLRRLMARDGLTEKDALRLIGAQMPLEEKKKGADLLIDNNGRPEETIREVQKIYEKLPYFLLEKRK